MLQWKNPRFLVVLALLASLAVSFGSWGWDLLAGAGSGLP